MRLPITPLKSVGPICFGADSAAVRAALASPCTPFRKDLDAPEVTDAFDALGLHVHYAATGCDAVELFAPAAPTLDGQGFFGRPFEEVKAWLIVLDPDTPIDSAEVQARTLGISISSSFSEDPSAARTMDHMLVASAGYFERQDALLAAALAKL